MRSGLFAYKEKNILKEDTPMTKQQIPYKIYLSEDEMPRQWYNVRADMPEKHPPMLNPANQTIRKF